MNRPLEKLGHGIKPSTPRPVPEFPPARFGALSIARLDLKPGDTLVVKHADKITREVASRIADHVRPLVPDGVKILVIESSLTLSVLSQPAVEPASPV